MSRILILYSTTDGHTLKISQRLQQLIAEQGHEVDVKAIDEVEIPTLVSYDKIVIGASIRYGKHQKPVYDFIDQHLEFLASRPGAFFSVNLVARKPGRDEPDRNPYVKKFLRQISWQPQHVAIFAGKLNYPIYGWLDRNIIRLIMYITRGPTDPATVKEFTDWQKVEEFGQLVSEM
ncbi:MAG: menaquinone-dependent protoporphyrinogen IX dehydrogenase [Gammaproteobacteria bacterium]